MSFRSGSCQVSASCRMGPASSPSSLFLLKEPGSTPSAAAAISHTCLTSVHVSNLYSSLHGPGKQTNKQTKPNSVALVRQRTIPTERPPIN
jgi:hypothetical protein